MFGSAAVYQRWTTAQPKADSGRRQQLAKSCYSSHSGYLVCSAYSHCCFLLRRQSLYIDSSFLLLCRLQLKTSFWYSSRVLIHGWEPWRSQPSPTLAHKIQLAAVTKTLTRPLHRLIRTCSISILFYIASDLLQVCLSHLRPTLLELLVQVGNIIPQNIGNIRYLLDI